MRQLLVIMLAIAMFFSLCSCKKQPATQTHTTTQPNQSTSPIVSNEDTQYEQMPIYAVSLSPVTEETADDEGKVRFVYSYQNLSLFLPEAEVAEKIYINYLSRMDQANQYAASVRRDSLDEAYDLLSTFPLFYDIRYSPSRFDKGVLSMRITESIYLGGVHPDTINSFTNYDLLSGTALNLSDILCDDVTAKSIANTVNQKLSENPSSKEFWTNYQDTVSELFQVGLEKVENWYLSNEGLCFNFDAYILASYATGPITVTIPHSELTGILLDEYFPAEQDNYTGTLLAESFTLDAQAEFSQFSEVVLAKDGTKILLSADGVLTDIIIQAGIESQSELSGNVVMAVQSLSPGDAIMVEFDSSTTKLLITYRNGDNYETKIITCDQDNITIS